MKVIIIEDENFIAENLKQIISKCRENYKIVKVLNSVESAIEYFRTTNVSDCLIFSDVSLGDGICFDIYNKVNISAPIIFCTAFDQYAIEAFNTNGIDYILKPINLKRVEKALEKFESLAFNPKIQNEQLQKITSKFIQPKVFLVDYREKMLPFEENAIALFYIEFGIVYLLDFKGQSFSINKSLDEIEMELGNIFYRANRQIIVNKTAIKDFERTDTRKMKLTLIVNFKETIAISKEKISEFKNWFQGL